MKTTLYQKILLLGIVLSLLASFKHYTTATTIEEGLLRQKTNSLIDNLLPGDTLKIEREINGCEMHSTESIGIYRRSDTLFASLTIQFNDDLRHPNLISSSPFKLVLGYNEFEKALKKYSPVTHGCTSTSEYCVSLRSDSIKLKDRACQFKGYDVFKEQLFGKVALRNYNRQIYH